MKTCLICGRNTTNAFADFVRHFRVIDWPQRHYVKGNFRTFGYWSGLRANITLMFPFLNTIINWKHRKSSLEIGEPSAASEGE